MMAMAERAAQHREAENMVRYISDIFNGACRRDCRLPWLSRITDCVLCCYPAADGGGPLRYNFVGIHGTPVASAARLQSCIRSWQLLWNTRILHRTG